MGTAFENRLAMLSRKNTTTPDLNRWPPVSRAVPQGQQGGKALQLVDFIQIENRDSCNDSLRVAGVRSPLVTSLLQAARQGQQIPRHTRVERERGFCSR